MRTTEEDLRLMQLPERWPFKVLLPLAHRTRVDELGSPLCAVIAAGHRTTVFYANVGDFKRTELQSRRAFDEALKRYKSVPYTSFRAILVEWRID